MGRTTRGIMGALCLLVVASSVEAAPKRPSPSAGSCSLSSDKFDQLAAKNPAGGQACRDLSDAAAKAGRAFSSMCDAATGEMSCRDDSTCVRLGISSQQPVPPAGGLTPLPTAPGGAPRR